LEANVIVISRTQSPLVAMLRRQQRSRGFFRKKNASLFAVSALHEAAHAAAAFQYAPDGVRAVSVLVQEPINAYIEPSPMLSLRHRAEVSLAGVAMDEMLFGHPYFALHDFCRGMHFLSLRYGDQLTDDEIDTALIGARGCVERNLQNIQALAAEFMARGVFRALKQSQILRAAAKSGLIDGHADPDYLSRFAATSRRLRADLGRDVLIQAHSERLAAWLKDPEVIIEIPIGIDCRAWEKIDTTPFRQFVVAEGRGRIERLVA
jgi:hypothetical protein